ALDRWSIGIVETGSNRDIPWPLLSIVLWHVSDRNDHSARSINDLFAPILKSDHHVPVVGVDAVDCAVIVVGSHPEVITDGVGQTLDSTSILRICIRRSLRRRGEGIGATRPQTATVAGGRVNQSVILLAADCARSRCRSRARQRNRY